MVLSSIPLPLLLCPTLIWLVLVFFFASLCFAVRDGVKRLRRLHQIPCNRCQYFTGDYRLTCTVHPYTAFSEDAICCCDYKRVLPKPQRSLGDSFLFVQRKLRYWRKP
jgi:hypothetical protein